MLWRFRIKTAFTVFSTTKIFHWFILYLPLTTLFIHRAFSALRGTLHITVSARQRQNPRFYLKRRITNSIVTKKSFLGLPIDTGLHVIADIAKHCGIPVFTAVDVVDGYIFNRRLILWAYYIDNWFSNWDYVWADDVNVGELFRWRGVSKRRCKCF